MKKLWGFATTVPVEGHMAGGTVFFHELCKKFVEAGWDVTIMVKPRGRQIISELDLDGVKYRREASPEEASLILLHSASLEANPDFIRFKQPILYILHSASSLISKDLHSLRPKDYLIANSRNMLETVADIKCHKMLIYPICNSAYYETQDKTRNYITTVGSSAVKNLGCFYSLAPQFPKETFLHIKGGYGHERYARPQNLRIVGNQADLRPYYAKTKILIVPSFSETYSLVAREAGLQGIPVICSSLPGLRENLGDTGLYANPHHPETFKKWIDRLSDQKFYRQMSVKIRDHCMIEEQKNLARIAKFIQLF